MGTVSYGAELTEAECTYENASAALHFDTGLAAGKLEGFGNVRWISALAICVYDLDTYYKTSTFETSSVWVNRATGYVWEYEDGEWQFDDHPNERDTFTRPSNPQCEPFPSESN